MVAFLERVAPQALRGRRWVLGGLVSGGLLALVLWWSAPRGVLLTLAMADRGWIVVALLGMLVVAVCRFVRLWFWLPASQRSWFLFGVVNGHAFLNQVLPFRTGELVFPALLRRATGRSYAVGLLDLVMLRVVELCVLTAYVLVAALAWSTSSPSVWPVGWQLGAYGWLIPGVLVGLVTLMTARRWALPVVGRRLRERAVWARLDAGWRHLREAVSSRSTGSLLVVVGSTVAMWLSLFVVYFSVLAACDVQASWSETILGSTGSVVANLLPINGIGSVGTMEAGWVAGFVMLGKTHSSVMAAGILLHVLLLVALAAMALFAVPTPRILDADLEEAPNA